MNDAFKTLSTTLPKASAQGSQPRCVILMEERAAGGSPTPLAFHFPAPDEVPPDCQGGNTGDSVEVPGVSLLGQGHPFLNPWLDCNEKQAMDSKCLL